eukprot:g1295.t1
MDLVWLKRGDARLHDHGAIAAACASGAPFALLFVYEPDQLAHHSVHGSHVEFVNEGLRDLDARLRALAPAARVSLARGEVVDVLSRVHAVHPLRRLLAHEETGHLVSYARDKRVRRWCRRRGVAFQEFAQTGVTRALRDRDDFTKRYNAFMALPEHAAPASGSDLRLLRHLGDGAGAGGGGGSGGGSGGGDDAHARLQGVMCSWQSAAQLADAGLLARAHAGDRPDRQRGGETRALALLRSFLRERGARYSAGISAPALAWSSCSRLSPYLTFGHVSLRRVVRALAARQAEARRERHAAAPVAAAAAAPAWPKSLAAFHSRLRWRSHFIQKLESEPRMEQHAQCAAYDALRTGPGEWRADHFEAWAAGATGFPMVDACMRALLRHGWLNFRMRAMLVSFACYNLWLDWRGVAPHLARCFLDYEPGIHYPQLQMQAGTTGINALRVYNVVKQGKDQDPRGAFIRKYVPELRAVPDAHVHEPHAMPAALQRRCGVAIGGERPAVAGAGAGPGAGAGATGGRVVQWYPAPIVDAQATARVAKERIAAVKRTAEARAQAAAVYQRHGSRSAQHGSGGGARSDFEKASKGKVEGKGKAKTGAKKRGRLLPAGQQTLAAHLSARPGRAEKKPRGSQRASDLPELPEHRWRN